MTLNTSVLSYTNACSTAISVTKTNNLSSLTAGGIGYAVTFTNTGVTMADGSNARDLPTAGLACSVASCAASAAPIAGVCTAPAQWPNLLAPGGLLLPGFPAPGTISVAVNCNVTATGLP